MQKIVKFTFILSLVIPLAYGAVYKGTTASGATIFSDTPLPNSTQISISQVNVVTANNNNPQTQATLNNTEAPTENSTSSTGNSETAGATASYTSISITAPADQTTFQNQYNVNISVEVKPELRDEDNVQLILDGAPYGKPQHTLTFNVENLSRGTHNAQAVIIGKNGTRQNVSTSITFYIHQPSQLLKSV